MSFQITPLKAGLAALGIGAAAVATTAIVRSSSVAPARIAGDVDDWDLREAQAAVTRAAPNWSSDAVMRVAEAMVERDLDRWDAEPIVSTVVSNAPSDWSDDDEATFTVGALAGGLDRYDTDYLLDGVRNAPSDWTTADEARVAAVAAANDKDRWDLESAIRWGSYEYGGVPAEVARAIRELSGPGTPESGSSWDYQQALNAVRSASSGWSAADQSLVAEAAVAGDAYSWDISNVIDKVEAEDPSSWSGPQEALVAAAALRHDRDAWDVGSVLSGISSAPSDWTPTGQARVAAAALQYDQDGYDVRYAINSSRYETSDPARQVVHAIADLADN